MRQKIFFGLGLLIVGVIMYSNLAEPENKNGNSAPDFDATLIDGNPFSLSDLRGKYVLLDFWGSWCPPCRKDNPNLVSLYEQFNSRGFEIVSIALEKNDKTWKKAIAKDGLIWPYHILRTSRLVATDVVALKYQVTDLPSKFLIDPKGEIVGVNLSKSEITNLLNTNLPGN